MCKTQFVYQSLQFTVVNYKGYDWWLSSWKWKSCAWTSQYAPFSPLEPRTVVPLCKWKCMGGKAFDCWRRIFALIHWKTGQRHSLWNWVTFANLISRRKANNCKSGIMSSEDLFPEVWFVQLRWGRELGANVDQGQVEIWQKVEIWQERRRMLQSLSGSNLGQAIKLRRRTDLDIYDI